MSRLPILALVAAAIATAWVVLRHDSDAHTLRAAFAEALQVVPGEKVKIAGREVGSVKSASLSEGRAIVEMKIDDAAWPLRRGTFARLRYGSPLGYALRYVELEPGPASAPTLPDGGILTQQHTETPVEYDQVTRIFGPKARRDFAGLLTNADGALRGEGPVLGDALARGGRGMEQIAGWQSELGSNPDALHVLLSSAGATAATLRQHDAQLQALVTDAATTLRVLTTHAKAVQDSLDAAPAALVSGRRTLARLDPVVSTLRLLVDDVRPGARRLRDTAPLLSQTTTRLTAVAPRLRTTLDLATATAPVIGDFLSRSTDTLPAIGSFLATFAPMAACLRPYTPEMAGALETTASAYAGYDHFGHYTRNLLVSSPIPIGSTSTPEDVTTQYPNIHYAKPRPPGMNVGQPWFQPQCGAGESALDAKNDAENDDAEAKP